MAIITRSQFTSFAQSKAGARGLRGFVNEAPHAAARLHRVASKG